jgi:serine/threonine protein phosphatase PrpC
MTPDEIKNLIEKRLESALGNEQTAIDEQIIKYVIDFQGDEIKSLKGEIQTIEKDIERYGILKSALEAKLTDTIISSYELHQKQSTLEINSPNDLTQSAHPDTEIVGIDTLSDPSSEVVFTEGVLESPPQTLNTEGGTVPTQNISTTQKPPKDMIFSKPNYTPPPPPPPVVKKMYLDNGEEGKEYSLSLDWQKLGLGNIGKHRFEGLEAAGLQYDEGMHHLSGMPTQTGELSFKLFFNHKEDPAGRSELERQVLIFIKPDTRKMFDREVEPEAGLPYEKKHKDEKWVQGGEKNIVSASRRGRSHAMDGRFRDDDMQSAYRSEDGWYIMVVADGAGSAKYSRQGSKIACETLMKSVQESDNLQKLDDFLVKNASNTEGGNKPPELQNLMYALLGTAAFNARKAISSESQAREGSLEKDYATTLLATVCKKFDFGWFIGSYWVGDGGIGVYFEDRDPIIMGTPDSGEFSGQTRFLTMTEVFADYNAIAQRLCVEIVPDFKALVLMTDGVTDALFHTDNNLLRKEKWDEFYRHLTSEVELSKDNPDVSTQVLNWLNFWEKGEYDDRTIMILY